MKYLLLAVFVASTICVPAFSKEQKSDFQTGQIVRAQKVSQAKAAPAPAGYSNPDSPSEAQEGASTSAYNVDIQVGDTIYTCQLKSYDPNADEFAPGSDVQARVTKRVLYLKRSNDDVVEARIVGKKKADAQAQVQ